MDRKYKVGGYVKLAKLWERSKDSAVAYHSSYYAEKFRDDADKRLVGVYIDITGNKEIYKRPEMVHLLKDCKKGAVNLIFSQTRAYLAANTCDFCFLLKYLFDLPMRVDIVTDDDDQRIDTILDVENKDITSLEFVENIFRLMNWNRGCRYKVLGRVANSDQGLCMLFDLEEAIMFTPKPQEYADPLTGEMKKKQMKFFPDTYRNRIGKSYNDYIADHQMNMFEDFIGYQGSAVLDEPVREEDSFSKESMSQESEISENILLPDLAKQSESIEQQSGEIAERGMPT